MAKAAKPKSTARRPAAPKPPKGAAAKASSPGSEVERRWKDYWERRSRLELAVEAVRSATTELKKAQEDEKARRAEFEEVKRSLTTLLDVDPVGAPARDPIPLPRSVPEPPKQVG
jgi:outer membrane protein TolC